jgi:hypothetical protein
LPLYLIPEEGDNLLLEEGGGDAFLTAESTPDGRVLVALTDGPLVVSQTWTRFDNLTTCRCPGFDIDRGRQSEFDTTDTGTARVYFHDRNQTTNDTSLVGLQIMLQAYNPVTATWVPQFRGHIDDITFDVNPAGVKSDVQFSCVDLFDFLGGVELELSDFGDPPPVGSEGTIFYEDGPVDDRIIQLLTEAGIASDMWVVFSGNVDVLETKYDPSDQVLVGLRDACDAEWVGIANCYADKYGRFVFHGRYARFDPEGTQATASVGAWDFTRWAAGDGAAVTASPTTVAQIRAFSYNYPRSRIINSYIAWPRGIPEAALPAQRSSDATSIAAYGRRGRSAGDLIVKEHKTNGNTGAEECQLIANWYVANYKDPRMNVQTVTFKSLPPGDARAAYTWELMCGIEISDVLALTVADAEITDVDYFVEGLSIRCRYLNPDYDYLEVTPNLTPAAYYGNPEP